MIDTNTLFSSLIIFTFIMIFIAFYTKKEATHDTFFTANRNVGVITTAISTAIGWMWADCLFSTSQVAFENGIYGLTWFAFLSGISFVLFGLLAIRVRNEMPSVVTIPEFVSFKSGNSKSAHISMLIANVVYQVFVLGLNATITGLLLHSAFGVNYELAASSVIILVLLYSSVNGLKTSTITGILQFLCTITIMGIIAFLLLTNFDIKQIDLTILQGTNKIGGAFNSSILINLVIPLGVILLTQPFVDQMIFQRLVALKQTDKIVKSFSISGLICAISVMLFGSIGFLGLFLSQNETFIVSDTQLAIVQTINHLAPTLGTLGFVIAFFCIIFSTVDAGYCAISALISLDIYKKYFARDVDNKKILFIARLSMLCAALLAILISLAKMKILWMLFIIGVVGGAMVSPIIFSMCTKKLDGRAAMWSILISLIISLPLSIWGNISGNSLLVSGASIGSILIGLLVCYTLSCKNLTNATPS